MDAKIKHLEMIQTIINRMANNSFLLKGWTVTLVSALIAIFVKNRESSILAIFPAVMMWLLDGFFLRQEKLYRALYNCVTKRESDKIDFLMDTAAFIKTTPCWLRVCFSKTLLIFYWTIIITIILISKFTKVYPGLWGFC